MKSNEEGAIDLNETTTCNHGNTSCLPFAFGIHYLIERHQENNLLRNKTNWLNFALKMDRLSLDAQQKVFAFLSINDRANCRLVSSSFKQMAEASLAQVTHLNMSALLLNPYKQGRVVGMDVEMALSYVGQELLSRTFVRGLVNQFELDEFFSFLGKLCPSLQVVLLLQMELSYENALQIASSVTFFSCDRFIPPPNYKKATSLFAPFPLLQGFRETTSKYHKSSNFLSAKLLQLKRPICKVRLNQKHFGARQLLARSEVRCLEIVDGSGLADLIPPNLAHSLVDLSLVTTDAPLALAPSDTNICFPNLKYLKIRVSNCNPFSLLGPEKRFLSAPNLKSFSFEAAVSAELVLQLFQYIRSLEELQALELKLIIESTDGQEMSNFPLLPKLQRMSLGLFNRESPIDCPLQILNSLHSVRYLYLYPLNSRYELHSLEFNLPQLEVFVCPTLDMKPSEEGFLQSLGKCSKLKTLKLGIYVRGGVNILQYFIDFLPQLPHLDNLELINYTRSRFSEVHFKQEKFPLLRRLFLSSHQKITFWPTDSFDSAEMGEGGLVHLVLRHKVWDRKYRIQGGSVEMVCTQQMNQLTKFVCEIEPTPEFLLSQSHYFTRNEFFK